MRCSTPRRTVARVLLYAHRGANRRAPENTLSAFRLAIEEGADGVELDVRVCASGEVVVAHDPHLGRVGERAAWVAMLPWPALRAVRIGESERVPLLDDAIDLIVGSGLRLNIEVKGDVPDRHALARAVRSTLARRKPSEREAMVLSTFSPTLLALLRRSATGVPIAFLFDREHTGLWRGALARRLPWADGLHPEASLCTEGRLWRWRERGFVNAWTVNDPERARSLAALGVDALITDDVPAMRAALSSG